MDNNNVDKTQEQEKSFITEKIKPKTRRKIKKVLEVAGLALFAAVIIGFVSRIIFVVSEDTVNRMFGVEEKTPDIMLNNPSRSEVRLLTDPDGGLISPPIVGTPTPSIEPKQGEKEGEDHTATPTPSTTATPPEKDIDRDDESHKNEEKSVDGEKNVDGEKTGDGEKTEVTEVALTSGNMDVKVDETNKEEATEKETDPIDSYIGMVGELKNVYAGVSESIVTVRSYTSGINWLDENIETYTDATGIILGENGLELLIMTSCTKTEMADRIEVILNDGFSVEASYFIGDPVIDTAIVAVKLEKITSKEKSNLRCICIGDSDELSVGDPIMAVGMPDGYTGSMAHGFVSATGRMTYVQDGILETFATGLPYHSGSDAVIVNMSGEMVGVISHYVEKNEEDRITMCVAINSIRDILINLLNGKRAVRLGVRAEDMPTEILKSMEIENGIYINEVVSSSPAEEAGLKKGDIITEIDNEPITNVKDMMSYLISDSNRAVISVTYFRGSLRDEPINTVSIELFDAE